ncbi:MAG: membrane protein insertase YidC [Candidatus Eisenbacteria bacterium]
MDRRTIVAIVLASLVLLTYQFVFAPKHQQDSGESSEATTRLPTSTETTPPTPTLGAASIPATETGAGTNTLLGDSAALVPEDVQSPLYLATVDPAGGVLSGWQLADYTDFEDRPADLVADPSAGLFELSLINGPTRIDLHRVPFVIQKSRVDGRERVTLHAEDPAGWKVSLNYVFAEDQYSCRVDLSTSGFPAGTDVELSFPKGLPRLEKVAKMDHQSAATLAMIDNHLVKHRGQKKEGWSTSESGAIRWVGARSKYFLAAAIFEEGTTGTYEAVGEGQTGSSSVRTTARVPLDPSGALGFRLYSGPLELHRLESYGVRLDQAVDLGWKPIVPFSRLLLACMNFLYSVIPNYGLAILILSVVTKVAFYPLTRKSLVSMREMQKLKPQIDEINAKYKDDAQRKQQAMMEMYRTNKINPLGGCLPMVIQMPVFVALYNVLANSVQLRKEPFVLWINDLSSPDLIGTVMGFPIHVLPLLMALTMVLQQRLQPVDPRQAVIGYVMPIMMLVFFYMLPSGLVFYWTINNVLQVGQQLIINRESGQQLAAA